MKFHIFNTNREQLLKELKSRNIKLNKYAEILLSRDEFNRIDEMKLNIIETSLNELNIKEPTNLKAVYMEAKQKGLGLLPLVVAPFIRLGYKDQNSSLNNVLSGQKKSPDGAINIATPILSQDDYYPKGFYIRKVENDLWLRGYICDDMHLFQLEDRFIFAVK
ncbi:hypothetical protein [Miniphocaeibacter halophilus]|uniref:Uncharacterized protein n=1 Tax=Miniphocaeibacter halophilus TaxID=2931922 RepID=A0AC61MR79_9FIRM|nr:hypothetical protein [Miniphocaeibacter halophilus]QQK08050.1 hypothetical protein JFY71_00495 [Miniphocaeibacter halophilus]